MERVVAYWSQQLIKVERNYPTIEWEALAISAVVREFYPYRFHFKVVTDHNLLTTFKELKDFGGRLSRWRLCLQQLDSEMQYRSGATNSDTDTLFRRPGNIEAVVAALQGTWSFS